MWRVLRQSILSLLALLLVGGLSIAQADTSPIGVALDQRVIDLTNTLDAATTERLKNQLADLEQRTGTQVAVLIAAVTLLLAMYGGGRDWPVYLMAFPIASFAAPFIFGKTCEGAGSSSSAGSGSSSSGRGAVA